MLGVTRQCVTGWCVDRKVRAKRIPGMRRWLIDPADVERLVQERRPDLWGKLRGAGAAIDDHNHIRT